MINGKVRMIEDVKNGKRILHPIIYLIVAYLLYQLGYLLNSITQLIYVIKSRGLESHNAFGSSAVMLFGFAFDALLIMLFVRFAEGRPIRSLGLYSKGWFKNMLKGMVGGIALISLAVGVLWLLGYATVGTTMHPTSFSLIILFLGFIVQGGTEEIISRGWLLNTISAKYNKIWGILLSTLFFLYCHIHNSGFNLLVSINIILFSIFLCLYVFKTDNLWGAIGFHAVWNFAIGNVFGMDVSGNKIGGGSIFHFTLKGNDFITGGAFGIEGGIIISLVLVLGMSVLLFWKGKGNITE